MNRNFNTTVLDFDVSQGHSLAVPISRSLTALSIEFCYIIDYLEDVHSLNQSSLQHLQNTQDLGCPSVIRVGGHTQDVSQYDTSNPATLSDVFIPGNLEVGSVTSNTNLFLVLGAKTVYPVVAVEVAERYLHPSKLFAYELGSEPDFYNVQTYAEQQITWLAEIKTRI